MRHFLIVNFGNIFGNSHGFMWKAGIIWSKILLSCHPSVFLNSVKLQVQFWWIFMTWLACLFFWLHDTPCPLARGPACFPRAFGSLVGSSTLQLATSMSGTGNNVVKLQNLGKLGIYLFIFFVRITPLHCLHSDVLSLRIFFSRLLLV